MRTRIATGLALAVAATVATLWLPPMGFAVLVLAILCAALVEWGRLEKQRRPFSAVEWAVGVVGLAVLVVAAGALFYAPKRLPQVCFIGLLFWAYQALSMLVQPTARAPAVWRSLLQGAGIVLFAWCALLWMRVEQGTHLTLAMLGIVWSADTCAYFVGKRFGKHKLAPRISPHKTVEGLGGGVLGAGLVALLVASLWLELPGGKTQFWLAAALGAALFSVVGDLYESRLKRRAEVKDSGGLLPGHGGVLDRVDGLLAAAPVFVTLWWWSA